MRNRGPKKRGGKTSRKPIMLIAIASIAAVIFASVMIYLNQDRMGITGDNVVTAMGSPMLGDPEAPLTVVEFGDYQCHKCYEWYHMTKPSLFLEYVETGKANFVFVDMAFLGRDSKTAAQASYCAGDQGKYWEYHDALYQNQKPEIDGGWAGRANLEVFALGLGMDANLFNECLDSEKYLERVEYNISKAESYDVRGTPTFLIITSDGEEETIVGAQPYRVFQRTIDALVSG